MGTQFERMRWATARLLFIVYITASGLPLVGGFLTAPLMTWYFFGDWRFWRRCIRTPPSTACGVTATLNPFLSPRKTLHVL